MLLLIVGTAVIAWHVGHAPRAFADDGGWQECKGTGKCKGIKGKGTYKGTPNADGTVSYKVDGEYSLSK